MLEEPGKVLAKDSVAGSLQWEGRGQHTDPRAVLRGGEFVLHIDCCSQRRNSTITRITGVENDQDLTSARPRGYSRDGTRGDQGRCPPLCALADEVQRLLGGGKRVTGPQ